MNTFADLDRPPFYTAIYLDPAPDADAGMHSDAAATMVSTAMLLSGYVGSRDDIAAGNRRIKIVYWKSYQAMRAWEGITADLLPARVTLDECIASTGCLWQWLDDEALSPEEKQIRAA